MGREWEPRFSNSSPVARVATGDRTDATDVLRTREMVPYPMHGDWGIAVDTLIGFPAEIK